MPFGDKTTEKGSGSAVSADDGRDARPTISSPARSEPLAVITGASSGIGRDLAKLLAWRGYRTVLIARRIDRLEALAAQLNREAPSAAMQLDLADPDAIAPAMRRLLEEHGAPEVLINNAGFGVYSRFLDVSLEDQRRLMQVNYDAAAATIYFLLPAMLERGRGHVINIGSIATKVGPWGHSIYGAAKRALVALTESLAAEYGDRSIHFSYVNPGLIRTEFFDGPTYRHMADKVNRYGICSRYIAKRIVGLLDRPRIELCVPRYFRVLDWIRAISPRLVLWLVARNSRPSADSTSRSNES